MLTKINNFKVHNVVLNILILISWYTLFLNNGNETGLCNNLHKLIPDCDSYHIFVELRLFTCIFQQKCLHLQINFGYMASNIFKQEGNDSPKENEFIHDIYHFKCVNVNFI